MKQLIVAVQEETISRPSSGETSPLSQAPSLAFSALGSEATQAEPRGLDLDLGGQEGNISSNRESSIGLLGLGGGP